MTYQEWFQSQSKKHKEIVDKLSNHSNDEIIKYFRFENMVKKELDFCPLYKDNKKCHDIDDLNCYFCGCPNFRLTGGKEKLKSYCDIDSKHGAQFVSDDAIHQDCSKCIVPHSESYIKKHFSKDWLEVMKNIIK